MEKIEVSVFKQKLGKHNFIYVAFETEGGNPQEKFRVFKEKLEDFSTSLVNELAKIGTDYTMLQLSFIPAGIQGIDLSKVMTRVAARTGLEEEEKRELFERLIQITSEKKEKISAE